MQIERLVRMVFYIVNHEHVTAKELANHFNVSTRTIYRDINILSIAGIPIMSTKGTGGGISLLDGYTIDKSLLTRDEQRNIVQGLQILQAAKYPDAETSLNKISAIFRNALEPKWLEVDFSFWGSDETEKVQISEIQYAIVNKHIISFDYFNSELQMSKRRIEPLRLVFKSHAWYMVGYCSDRQDIRTFRMSRMKHIKVTPDMFQRDLPPDFSLTPEYKEEYDIPVFKLKFSPEIAYRLYDEFHESQVTLCEDGTYLVTTRYQLNNWTFHYLLSFGKYVEIIEPEIARVMLRERALAIVRLYT